MRSIWLSGPMGSGKSSVGPILAADLGWDFVDIDALLEARHGRSVAALFAAHGEPGFRALEREAVRAQREASGPAVVALGGGAVLDRETRRGLLSSGVLVTLRAPVDVLVRRVGGGEGRPLLAGGVPVEVLGALLSARASAYAECHAEVQTAGRTLESIAREVRSIASCPPVVVPLGERTYRVEIGRGTAARLGRRSVEAGVGPVVVVVGDVNVADKVRRARADLEAVDLRTTAVLLPAGEAHKRVASVEAIWDAALEAGIDRGGAVVAVGGGVVGDLAGFAASTLLRGLAFAQVPTTLLAMVDSSVGGKTGFDRAQGKNLVGSFHQPRFVLCDVDALSTLDPDERRSGLAEVVKAAWIEGEAAVQALEANAEALHAGDPDATLAAVRTAVALKARIVAEDEHETGDRALLNLGHTLGHAMEAASGYAMRHGDAVARGMVAALRVGRALERGRLEDEIRIVALLRRLGLPTDPTPFLDAQAFGFVHSDKKRRGDAVRFVCPAGPGDVSLTAVPIERLRAIVLGP